MLSAGWFGLNVSGQVAVACDGSSMNGTQLMNAMRSVPGGNILPTGLQRYEGIWGYTSSPVGGSLNFSTKDENAVVTGFDIAYDYIITYIPTSNPGVTYSVIVNVGLNPSQQTVSSSNICAPGNITLHLSASEVDVEYYVRYNNGTVTTDLGHWTSTADGATHDFGSYSGVGDYRVVAGGCLGEVQMTGEYSITSPPSVYPVHNPGIACPGTDLVLADADAGVTYWLKRGGTRTSAYHTPAFNGSISFGGLTVPGLYTVEAERNGCISQMTGSLQIEATPNIYILTANKFSYCAGAPNTGVELTLSNSQSGIRYQLQRNTGTGYLNYGSPVDGSTGAPLTAAWQNLPYGTYRVLATTSAGCPSTMNGVITITESVEPSATVTTSSPNHKCVGESVDFYINVALTGVQPFSFDIVNNIGDPVISVTGHNSTYYSVKVDPAASATYTLTNLSDGSSCNMVTNAGTADFFVRPLPVVNFASSPNSVTTVGGVPTTSICSESAVTLGVNVSNTSGPYTYGWNHGLGSTQSVTFSPAATQTYEVTVHNEYGCGVTRQIAVVVNPLPFVDFTLSTGDYTVCENEGIVTLQPVAPNTGGTFSGPGVTTGNFFNPAVAGASTLPRQITYTFLNATTGCENSITKPVIVNPEPNVIVAGNQTDFCADQATGTLRGFPQNSNGQWVPVSGSKTWFTDNNNGTATINIVAALADGGENSYAIDYIFTDPVTGCVSDGNIVTINIRRDLSDNVDFRVQGGGAFPASLCQGDAPVIFEGFLDGSPIVLLPGGTFSGPGITDNGNGTASFDPDEAGTGMHTISYNYTDPVTSCSGSMTRTIQIGTTLSLHGLSAQYCADNNVDQEWYGLVTGGELIVAKDGGPTESVELLDPADRYLFNPQAKGAGDYEVTYRFTSDPGGANECVNEITQEITVRPVLNAAFDTDDSRRIYCLTNGPVNLLPAPVAGSSYTGTGVGMGVFNPAVAGVGIHRIKRTVQDGFCSVDEFIDVEVVAPDVPVVLRPYEFCYNETGLFPVEAGDLPVVGGVYSRDQAEKNVYYTFSTDAVNALFRFQADGVTRDYASTFTVRDGDTPIYFDPSRVPAIGGSDLTINIYLEYDSPVDEGGCEVYTVQPILVKSVQAVNFGITEPMEFCQNSTPVVMEGRFSGSGAAVGSGYFTADFPMDNEVDGPGTGNNGRALFDPSLVTPTSAYQITYNYEHPNGCVSTRTKSFEIKAAPIKQRVTPVDPNGGIFCQGSGGVTIGLQGTQIDVRYILQKDGVDVDAAVQFIDGQLPGNTPRTFPNPVTEPGVYTVRAIMIGIADGCDAQMEGSVIVDEKVVVGVLESTSHETCAGSDNGSVTFSAYGGVAPYTYTLQQVGVDITTSASGTFGGLAPGAYTVHIEDAVGCDWTSAGFEIKAGSSISVVSENEIDVVCFGESNGAFTVVATGLPSGNYEFQLSGSSDWLANGTGRYVFNNLPAGTYDVTVRDADNPGCQTVMTPSVVIAQPTEAVYMAVGDVTDITCSLDAEGEIEVEAAGGHTTGGFNYVLYKEVSPGFWVNIAASPASVALGTPYTFPTLFAGNYRVVATDSEGCSVTEEYTVDGPASLPIITLSGDEIVHVSQPVLSDGSIQIAITGGEEPYSITWTEIDALGGTPVGAPLIPGVYRQEYLSAGFYRVTVLDDNGCDDVLEAEILDDAVSAFDLTYTTVNPGPCFGSTNGRINLRAVGGITPYLTLTLTNSGGVVQTPHSAGNSFANYENLSAGNYTATVVDSRGVSLSETIELTQPSAPVAVSHTVADATCFGDNGNLVFSATGGTPFNNGTTGDPTDDYYNFSILPVSGIAITGTIEVGETIDVQADLPATEHLPAGTYQLTVTDAVSCFAVHNFTISEPEEMAIEVVDRQHNLCHGASEGSISVSVDGRPGGTAFDFVWERYDETIPDWAPYATGTSASISNLAAGTYRVKATETAAASCESEFSGPITISQPAVALAVVATPNDISTCNGDATGSVRLSLTGGTESYTIEYGTQTISWNGLNDYIVSGLVVGTYDFTITDDNGCFDEVSAIINEPALFEASVLASGIDCEVANTGWIELNVSGGVDANGAAPGGFEYQVRITRDENQQVTHNLTLNDPALPISVTGLQQGKYIILVKDRNSTAPDGCSHTFEVELRNMVINANVIQATCSGINNGSIEAIVTGGSGDYDFAWTGPGTFTSTDSFIENLEPGTYELTVTDNIYGCTSALRSYTIDYEYTLAVSTIVSDVSCFGGNDGSSTAMPTGGTMDYFYLWEEEVAPGSWSALANTATLSNRTAGTYRVTVTDAKSCEVVSTNVIIDEPDDFDITSVSFNPETVSCNGGSNGSFTVNMNRAGNFEYSIDAVTWQLSPTFDDLAAGSYRISVRDRVRDLSHPSPYCAKYEIETATILEAIPVVITLDNQVNVNCYGADTGALTVSATGGTAPYTYQWVEVTSTANVPLAGETNAAVTNLVAGKYFVRVTDNNSCLITSEVYTITQPASPIKITHNIQNVTTFGGNNGSITIAISGGTPGYTINWFEGVGTGGTALGNALVQGGLVAGFYTVEVIDGATAPACSVTETIQVTQPGDPLVMTVTSSTNPYPCHGASNGSIELEANGGEGPYTFTLTLNPGTEMLDFFLSGNRIIYNNLAAGFYTARVQDNLGNVVELTDLELTQPDPVDIYFFSPDDISCFGAADGSILFSISGGTPDATNGYSYILRPESSTEIIGNGDIGISLTGLYPDNYTLIVYDATNICFTEHSFTLTESDEIVITETISPVSCNGLSDGSIRIEVSGGIEGAAYSYDWFEYNTVSSGWDAIVSSNPTWLRSSAGRYKVEVTELGGAACFKESSEFILTEPDLLTATADPTDVNTCPGDNSGRITVTVSGGDGNYLVDYGTGTLSGNGPEFFIDGLVADDYTIVVRDNYGSGCQAVATATVGEPAEALSVTVPVVDYTCVLPSTETHSVSFDINGGVGITNGTDDEFSYHITVRNVLTSGTKTKTVSATIDQPVTVNLDDLNLGTGTYRLIVTDAQADPSASCAAVEHFFTISRLTVSHLVSPVTCPGAVDGAIDITVSGGSGNGNYMYEWLKDGSPMAEVSPGLSGLEDGLYTLTVTDLGQPGRCPYTRTYTVANAKTLVVNATVSPVRCFGGSDGAIRITGVDNAAPGLSYFWNGSAVAGTNELTGLAEGDYYVEIFDGDGCRIQETFEVTQPTAALEAVMSASLDCGTDTRIINVGASGGTANYSYQWMGPGSYHRVGDGSGIVDITSGGTWQVEVTDARGCKTTETTDIYGKLQLSTDITNVNCNNGTGGNIILNVDGGSGNYSYVWTKDGLPFAQTFKDIVNLEAGVYAVTVTDNFQFCGASNYSVPLNNITVSEPGSFDIESSVTNNECYGEAAGFINITNVSGGTAPYNYIWTTTNGSGLIAGARNQNGLTAGDYTLHVRDSKGCLSLANVFTVTELPELVFDLDVDDTDCNNENRIEVINAAGGSGVDANYVFTWDGNGAIGSNDRLKEDLPGGIYTITMVDISTSNGCSLTKSVQLIEPLNVTSTVIPENCMGSSDGAITLNVTGGTQSYSFQWDAAPGIVETDRNQTDLPAGNYRVVVTDSRSPVACDFILNVTVPLVHNMELQLTKITNVRCYGEENGEILVEVYNGSGNYTYEWKKGAFTSSDDNISGLAAGDYTLKVTDNLYGCTVTGLYQVLEPDFPLALALDGPITHNDCKGDRDGAINIDVTGGSPNYEFYWTGPGNLLNPTNQNQIDLAGGDYYVTVKDAFGCEVQNLLPFTVDEPAEAVTISLVEVIDVTSVGAGNGSILINVTGGSGGGYEVRWFDEGGNPLPQFDDSNYADELDGGIYSIVVTDDKSCPANLDVTVFEPGEILDLVINKENVGPCVGANNGRLLVRVIGGVMPYQKVTLIDGGGIVDEQSGGNSFVFDNLAANDYELVAVDAMGAELRENVRIIEPDNPLMLDVSVTQNVTCRGSSDGIITAEVSGGITDINGDYSLILSGGPAGTSAVVTVKAGAPYTFTGLPIGNYSVRVIDDSNVNYVDGSVVDLATAYGDGTFDIVTDCSVLASGLTVTQPDAQMTLSVVSGSEDICSGTKPSLRIITDNWPIATTPLNVMLSDGTFVTVNTSPFVFEVDDVPAVGSHIYTISEIGINDPIDCVKGTATGAAHVTVRPIPTASIQPPSQTICAGDQAELELTLSGNAPWQVVLSDGTVEDGITTYNHTMVVNPTATTTYSIASVSDAYCSSNTGTGAALVTINPSFSIGLENAGNYSICEGTSQVLVFKVSPSTGGPWQITYSQTELVNGSPVGASSNRTISVSSAMLNVNGEYSINVNPSSSARFRIESVVSNGCAGTVLPGPVFAVVGSLPELPGNITGPNEFCQGTSQVFTIPLVTGASHYEWLVPDGWLDPMPLNNIIVSNNSVSIDFANTAETGILAVRAVNDCGESNYVSMEVSINPLPNITSEVITGPANICQGSKGVRFTVDAVPFATSYRWTVPNTWNIVGQGSRQILLDVPDGITNFSGVISVTPVNSCGDAISSITYPFNVLPNPSANAGLDLPNHCGPTVTLDASPVLAGEVGRWEAFPVSGFGYANEITDVTNPKVQVTGLSEGDVTFRWVVKNSTSSCASYDDVTVRNNKLLVTASADMNTVCDGSTTLRGTPLDATLNVTGQWTVVSPAASSASFANAASPVTSVSNMPVGENKFLWTLNQNGCPSEAEVTVINDQVDAATINGLMTPDVINLPCGSTGITLTGNIPGIATGRWSVVSGSAHIADMNSNIAVLTNIGEGEAVLEWRISKGACYSSAQITIRNNKLSSVSAGEPATICDDFYSLNGSVHSGAVGTWIVPAGVVIDDASNPKATVTNLNPNGNIFTWRVIKNGCTSEANVTITSNKPADAIIPDSNFGVCDFETTLRADAVNPAMGEGRWTLVSGSGNIASALNNETQVTNLGFGNNTFKWTVSKGACSDEAVISIYNGKVDGVFAGKDTVVCDNIVTLRGSLVPAGASGIWRIVGGAGGAVITIEDPSRPHIAKIGLGEGSNTIIWEINNAGCYSRDTVVVVNSRPYPVNGGDPIRYVTLPDIYMNATPVGPDMTGEWVLISGNGNIENPYDPNTRVTNLARGENLFRWIVTNGNCSDYAEVLIVNGDVVDADAGRPETICGNTTRLEANDPQGAIGKWTVISGTANFESDSDPRTRVYNLSPGDNILRWTIRYGSSEYSSSSYDDVTITNNLPDEAKAGNDVAFCDNEYQLKGNPPTTVPINMGTPKWTIISGGGDLEDENDPVTYVRNLAQGENRLVYSITKGICERTDTVSIINGLPSEPYAGEDDAVCDDNYLLNPSTPVHGTARWRPGSTGGAQFDGNRVYNLAQGDNVLIYEIATEWCSLEDSIVLTNNKPSDSFAGMGRDWCQPNFTMEAHEPQYGIGTWEKVSGGGVIAPEDLNNPVAEVTGLTSGSNRFRWVVDNNGCPSVSEVEIRYNFIAADAGDDFEICEDFTWLNGSNPMQGEGTWGVKGGSGSAIFEDVNDPLTRVSGLDRGPNVLTWTVNNVNCPSVSEVLVYNNKPTVPEAGDNQSGLCEPETILQGNTPAAGVGRWTVISGSATFNSETYTEAELDPNARVSGLSFGPNTLRWTISTEGQNAGYEGCSLSDEVVLTYNKVEAFAGNDAAACADEMVLSARNPSPGTGMWSVPGGQGAAVFEDPTSPNTRVYNLGRGQNTLRWTVWHNGCSTYDEVVIDNQLPSLPYAGNEQPLCTDETVLDATPPEGGSTGSWRVVTGSAVFEDETDPKTAVSGLAKGDNIFIWTTERIEGCVLEDEVLVQNHEPSDPYAGADYEEVCANAFTLKATAPEYGSGIWSFEAGGGNLSNPNDPEALITALNPGRNLLRWTVSQGQCSKWAEVEIINNTPTKANAGPDIEDCKDTQTLDANVPVHFERAYWERISGYGELDDPSDPKTVVRNLAFGANEFQWVIENGSCSSTDRVVIFNQIPDKAFAGSDQPAVCENYTVLNANDPETGLGKWTVIKGSGTFDDETLYNTIVRNVGFGENIYRWEVAYGECGTFDEVAVISNKTEAYAGENQVVYTPEAILNANNAGELDSRWIIVGTSTATLADANFFNTAVSNLNEGINTFRWEINVNGCITYDLVSIDYRPVPDAGFITDVDAGCYPLRVLFTNYSVGGSVYMWDFGDGSTSGDRNPVHTYTEPGTYNVKLVAPGPDGNDGVFNKTIEVFEHPVADFTVNPQIVYIPGDNARFYDLSTDAVSWLWDFGDGTSSNERNPSYQYSEEGVYDVTLIVSNSNGCSDTLTVEEVITAEAQGYLVFPNAFKPRPGGASGPGVDPSSEYVVVFKPAFSDVDEFTLEIFNRWGQRIFKTNDINTGWDGMYEGQMAPQAVYVYLATGKYVNGREFRKTGSVLLVR